LKDFSLLEGVEATGLAFPPINLVRLFHPFAFPDAFFWQFGQSWRF
jgi:hypothetical protein